MQSVNTSNMHSMNGYLDGYTIDCHWIGESLFHSSHMWEVITITDSFNAYNVGSFLLFTLLQCHRKFCLFLFLSQHLTYCLTNVFLNFACYKARNDTGNYRFHSVFWFLQIIYLFFSLAIFEKQARLLSTHFVDALRVFVSRPSMRGIQTTLRPFLNCTLQIAYFSLNVIMRFL